MDDVQLVAALRAHDERAYTAAWIELGPMVRRLVTRFFGPGADTPDLSQEVFLRLFRRIEELRNPDGLRGFVVGICLGVARNELRRARVRRWVRLSPSGDLPDWPTEGPDLEAREALRRLYAILDGVGAHDRSLFVARFLEKMEIAEVAVAHQLSYGTAKRHVARAVGRITRRMGRDPMLVKYLDATIYQRDQKQDQDGQGGPTGQGGQGRQGGQGGWDDGDPGDGDGDLGDDQGDKENT